MFRTLLITILGTLAGSAHAHITLQQREAPVGATYKAVLRVPHGCDGTATTAIRVRIPEGVIGVKPMPKPGWKLDLVSGKYPRSYTLRGADVSEGVTEVRWSAGSLPDAFYDEFVFTGTISDGLKEGSTIYFPVVQECEKGVHRWIEIPSAQKNAEPEEPAPGLKLLPKR